DRYRKFIRTLNRVSRKKGRLLYWQEQLWGEFASRVAQAREYKEHFSDFCVCDLHDCPLQSRCDVQPLLEIRDTPEYDAAIEGMFPYANAAALVCADCRAARDHWISDN